MKKINFPDRLEVNLEVTFARFGEFTFKENQPEKKEPEPAKGPSSIYVFPKTTAAIAEL